MIRSFRSFIRKNKQVLYIYKKENKNTSYLYDFLDFYKESILVLEEYNDQFIKIIFANKAACNLFNLSAAELIRKDISFITQCIKPEDIDTLRNTVKKSNNRDVYVSSILRLALKGNNYSSFRLKVKIKSVLHKTKSDPKNVWFVSLFPITGIWSKEITEENISEDTSYEFKACSIDSDDDLFENDTIEYDYYNNKGEQLKSLNSNYYDINITRNWCKGKGLQEGRIDSIDGVIYKLSQQIDNEQDSNIFIQRFSRQNLIKRFNNNHKTVKMQYYGLSFNGRNEWMEAVVRIERNPLTEDIEGVLYLENISEYKLMKTTIEHVIKHRYNYLLSFNINTGYGILYESNNENIITHKSIHYNTDIIEYLTAGLFYPDRAKINTLLSCTGLKKMLPNSDSVFHKAIKIKRSDADTSTDISSCNIMIKKISASYLDYDRDLVIMVCQDISDYVKKNYENSLSLKKAYEEIKRVNDEKTEFLNRISHDIRTPINGIMGLTAITLNKGNFDELTRQNLLDIKETSKYLAALINDSLDLARIGNGKLRIVNEKHNFLDVVNNIIATIKPIAQKKNQNLELTINNCENKAVYMDSIRISQIFLNLLSNSIKYTPDGGTIACNINKIGQTENISHICIKISDNGIGISKEFLPRIFEPFARDYNGEIKTMYGTGLGLSIVKNIVELMKGSVSVDSEIGKGTTFTVYLDFLCANQTEINGNDENKANEHTDNIRYNKEKVLLCEDNRLNAKVAVSILEEKGLEVVHVSDGEQAVDTFIKSKAGEYAIILMDIRMPVMNGIEATKKIRNSGREDANKIPIIAMTANIFDSDINKCHSAGMNDYISKPIDIPKFFATINKYIL